ncbi:MAG: cytochrome P450 [Pseudomonadota bacterium]|nr:cytochrome P450 [Pseudomonadota bacterium]
MIPVGAALALLALTVVVAGRVVLPALIYRIYVRSTAENRPIRPDVAKGAGTFDIDYFACAVDLSRGDLVLDLVRPRTRYLQIGLYDTGADAIPTAHLTSASLPPGLPGEPLSLRIVRDARGAADALTLDAAGRTRTFLMVRALDPEEKMSPPALRPAPSVPVVPGLPVVGNLLPFLRDPIRFVQQAVRDHGDIVVVNGLLTNDGDDWRRRRKLIQPAFRQERIRAYSRLVPELADRLVDRWTEGETRDIHADMSGFTLDIVTRALFGRDVSDRAAQVGEALDVWMRRYENPLVFVAPWLDHLPTRFNRRLRRGHANLEAVVRQLIAEARAESGQAEGTDLLSTLVRLQDEEGRGLTDEELRDEVITLLLAGHETTSNVLAWTWMLLSRSPGARRALDEELGAVLGGRAPAYDDIGRLPYVEAVVKESMRLYPPAWQLGRDAVEDVTLGGYAIPKGANIFIAPVAIHRDARWFPEPEAFRPERWLDGSTTALPRGAWLPFGAGPRICIGGTFAMMELVLAVATIARRVRLELAEGFIPEPQPSVTLRPRAGMRMVVRGKA